MGYGRRIHRTLAPPVCTCLAATVCSGAVHFTAVCAEKSRPPSLEGVGDGAWTAGGCQHSYVFQGPEIYLTGTDGGGMCPPHPH